MSVLVRARLINFGLLVMAAVSVIATVWTARLPTSAERAVRQGHLLPVFREDDVSRIEVHQGPRRTVITRRPPRLGESADEPSAPELGEPESAEWRLVEPFETDADPAPVEKLLGSLQYATWEREVPGGVDPAAQAGGGQSAEASSVLSAREIAIQMGALAYHLRLGRDALSPPGSKYVEVEASGSDKRVYVIKKRLADELFVDADAFRGRQLVPYRKSSIERLTLSSAAGVRRLRRVGSDFHFEGMEEEQRAERQGVERIFLALSRVVAEPFVDVAVAQAALSVDKSVRISLIPTAADKPEASLEFGGECPGQPGKALALRHLPEPLAGCVPKDVLWPLREPASALIDRGLFGLSADEVDTVRIVEGEQVLELARGGDGFVLRQPREAELDAEAARDRLSRILDIQGELLTGQNKPANASQYSSAIITLESSARLGEERVKETVRVSAPLADGSRRAFREVDGAVLVIPAEGALSLRADATLLKEHQVFNYAVKDVRAVDVVSGSVKQRIERTAEGGLTLVSPKGYDVDGGLAVELIDQLRTLRALRWVTDRESTGFGLDKPRAVAKLLVEVEGRQIERTLQLGRSAPGGYYARVDRDPGIFVAPRAVERALGTWLIDRAVFSADPESVVELSLIAEGRGKIILRRVLGVLTPQKGTTEFEPSRIDELLEALASLRPEAAVHLGAAPPSEGFRRPILTGFIRRQSPKDIGMPPVRFSVGSRDSFRDASIYYARHASVNATYALPREQVQRLLDFF
jgi:hypothetical protein